MSIDRKIIANTIDSEEMRVAILEDGKLQDIFFERMWERQKTGEIYIARVESVLPGIHAAFVSLGDGRNAFLYLNDAKGFDLKPNSQILVQIVKTARKNKGARVTARISIPGRYLVIVPGGHEIGVSKRIDDEEERERLRSVAKKIRKEGFGIIIRTAADGVDEEELHTDMEYLIGLWTEIEHNSKTQNAPCLIYRDLGLVGRVLRDELTESVSEIVVDNREEYERIQEHLHNLCRGCSPDITLHEEATPLFEQYGIERELETILDRKVWLRSGAYLVIDQTEALTLIDVNTGKYTGSKDLRHTVLSTNLEAADEIARQLRVRAIGGIVVIDFIDMDYEEDRKMLVERLDSMFQGDRYRAKVFGVTQLGLVEITRKRARQDIRGTLTRGCPFCGGYGWVLKEDTVAVDIKRFLRKVVHSNRSEALLLEAHPVIARYIAETYLKAWEEELGRKIFIKEESDFSWSKYRLDYQGPVQQIEHKIGLLHEREADVVVHQSASS